MVVIGGHHDDGRTPAGRTWQSQKVLHTRDEVQEIMRDALCAEVERVMGRKMIAFMSDNHVEPDMGVEVSVLQPETASRLVPTGGP